MEPVRYPQGRSLNGGCNYRSQQPRRPQNQTATRSRNDYERFPIGMAYVPWQTWGDLYPAEKGLCEGTIFMELNQIFCGKRGNRA